MKITSQPKAFLSNEALQLLNLYESLGQRAEIFLPRHIFDNLTNFVTLCMDEPNDPARQQAEIDRYLLKFREDIPGYQHVSLMLVPHNNSKAFELSARRGNFIKKIDSLLDTDGAAAELKGILRNIKDCHDLSVGTPPVNSYHIDFMSQVQLGGYVRDLRKYRDVIGVTGDINEAHWNYLMDTLEQMIAQSTHYTTKAEVNDFLHRSKWAVNFKGMNGLIRTVVSGNADKAVELLCGDVFNRKATVVMESPEADELYERMTVDTTSVFVVKVKHARINHYSGERWFPLLTRLVIVDDSKESRSSNTSLVFCFHNGIINTLNKVHTKKLGSPANTQLNLRLILENVNASYLQEFREKIEVQIAEYEREIAGFLHETDIENIEKRITLFKLDAFSRQVVKDKYSLEKLRDFIFFLENCHKKESKQVQTHELIEEFENRMQSYFYAGNKHIDIITILEGGGRNQIKTFGDYLRQKKYVNLNDKIRYACKLILDIIPTGYERTLKNHFHKNFGINLFSEKYQEYLRKIGKDADNKGRYEKFLIDLGIRDKYFALSDSDKDIVKNFLSSLGNIEQTSISDAVQMIIRDLLFNPKGAPKPYIIYNAQQAWEYKDLLPDDCFDINPFDTEIENMPDGRLAYERLTDRLKRIKSTLALFDDSGSLWDLFCENTTILVNDPNNPTGYSDYNTEAVNNFLTFLNSSKITLFLDEAYAESVKIEDKEMPKWRTISRYILNNIGAQSKIKAISSLSTTKNLAATGERLGAIAVTPSAASFGKYARKCNSADHGNNNSLLMLNNILETAEVAKSIKDRLEIELPKNASRSKIKNTIVKFITTQIEATNRYNEMSKATRQLHKSAGFEGSPLYIFLLDELLSLDKLDVLGLPDDFKYKDEPFFIYYQNKLIENLNRYRINKNFRSESLRRLKMTKEIARRLITGDVAKEFEMIDSDGSYLFNFRVIGEYSYPDLLSFCRALATYRGVATVPYPTGLIRFSLGGYVSATSQGLKVLASEIEDAFAMVIKYWMQFAALRRDASNKEVESATILGRIFACDKDKDFIESVIEDYSLSKNYTKDKAPSLLIRDVRSLYHTSPEKSGVTITTIGRSKNSVIELHGDIIGSCKSVFEFVSSRAFTKVYENLLAQVYKRVPSIADLDFNTVSSRYSKAIILKYITNKKTFQPNNHVLDHPEEMNVMREILIEMEHLLFSDSKMKILAITASGNADLDKAKLEGINSILKKFIREILLHFNLPFEKESLEPSRKEIIKATGVYFEDVTGIRLSELNLNIWIDEFVHSLRDLPEYKDITLSQKSIGFILDIIGEGLNSAKTMSDKMIYLYLLNNDNSFYNMVCSRLKFFSDKIDACDDNEIKMFTEEFVSEILPEQLREINRYIMRKKDIKIAEDEIYAVTRKVVRFYISMIKRTKGTDYYNRYAHTLVRLVETAFKKQNSSVNEMIQHGVSIYKNFEMENKSMDQFADGSVSWINELMTKCGVISSEQPVQEHTRIVTDAKKREYPFHKIDRAESVQVAANEIVVASDYAKYIDLRPDSSFFCNRLRRFVANMDSDDYRCKVVKHGIVKELVIFQKGYMKYLTDNYRLNYTEDITIGDIKNFTPDVISLLGAPEKLISFPQIGYFDIKGPNGNIKTIVTPLKSEADYFGDVKKPRLTVINEKVKELGGIPRHGSLFLVEENDGSVFCIEINGDSGVGKSEMIAAFILRWLRNNLEGIRSIKMIAGDMYHEFQDADGSLYGIGTEVGDFSRTTDFDPDYIKYYKYLFESSADSNVEDLNSRSTVSGMCDITMPYKIDIMLAAGNYSKQEAGITRVDNPENFLLYIDAHGERKEKATSGDGPNFYRTLKRYTADKNIVEIISRHGNYLDDILDWELNASDKQYYLCSSYKLLDKIDVTEVVKMIFVGHSFSRDGIRYSIEDVSFDMIQNRFTASVSSVCSETETASISSMVIDRKMFSALFDAIASTPGGQPFIAEEGQIECVNRLIECLRGGKDGNGKARNIQCGLLSTEIGKKGREITGPQKAAAALKQLIQEVRVNKPEINDGKVKVKRLLNEKYQHIFSGAMNSDELWRYNFYLYQLENMRKSDLRRMDNIDVKVDVTNLVDFVPCNPQKEFSPLLVSPNLNIEISSFSETFEELMSFPNYSDFADEFAERVPRLYIAEGYSPETNINNMIVQLLLMEGYVSTDDLARGSVIEKVNRETIAAAKHAVVKYLEHKGSSKTGAAKTEEPAKKQKTVKK